jgi:hypothetical protein
MSDIFAKVIKWCISTTFAITGWGCLILARDYDSIKPVFISVVSFGVVYWLYEWGKKDISKPRIVITVLVFIAALAAALYVQIDNVFFYYGNIYYTWWVWCMIIGIPVMAVSYKKYD